MKRFFEIPIDVEDLKKLLLEEWSKNTKGENSPASLLIAEYRESLRKNTQAKKVRKFLIGLRKIYGVKGDCQPQLLIAQFIKDALPSSDDLKLFKFLFENAAYDTFSPRMKCSLRSDLDDLKKENT